jgi:hypothetical protein
LVSARAYLALLIGSKKEQRRYPNASRISNEQAF